MSQMDATTFKVDMIEGSAAEMFQWHRDLHVSKDVAETAITTKKEEIRYPLSPWLWYEKCLQIVSHSDARMHEGYKGIDVLDDPTKVAMNAMYLHGQFQYPLSNMAQGQGIFLDTYARLARANDASFKENYDQLTSLPLKLISQVQKLLGETMQKFASSNSS